MLFMFIYGETEKLWLGSYIFVTVAIFLFLLRAKLELNFALMLKCLPEVALTVLGSYAIDWTLKSALIVYIPFIGMRSLELNL